MNSLQELWSSGDKLSINKQPCTVCGAAEGDSHMLLCNTCNRPFHLQFLHLPCPVVPDGDWHCHLCDEHSPMYMWMLSTRQPLMHMWAQKNVFVQCIGIDV